VEAHAALVRAAGAVVLDPVARVDVGLAVRELDRDLHGDLAVRRPEHNADVLAETDVVGGLVEVMADDVEVGDLGATRGLAVELLLRRVGDLRRLVRVGPLSDRCRGLGFGHLSSWSASNSDPRTKRLRTADLPVKAR
jgi:hypothetical protein